MELNEAIRVLIIEESIEDFVYTVRERAVEDGEYPGHAWTHPRVMRFSEACMRLKEELKE